jgi:ABC-type phosphate transport system substrate-binding protein
MTRRSFHLVLANVLAFAAGSVTGKEPFVVIVNKSNRFDSLTRAKLRYLFLRKVSRWPWGAEVYPIDLKDAAAVRREFTGEVLNTTEHELAAYWIDQRMVRGVAPPVEAANPEAARALVAGNPGAIAYIPPSALDDTVKALRVE